MDEESHAVEAKKNEWPSVRRCVLSFRHYALVVEEAMRLSIRWGAFIVCIIVLIHDEEIRIEEFCRCGRSRFTRKN